ncbi:MAG: hypothetical protein E5X61_38160 [Mesorhizobium sp.]|nr:MAG: hypothetical protein E5X61_38160 [Mesorhizobium sp.]
MSQRRLATLEVRSASKVYESGGSPVTALAEGSLTLSPGAVSGIVGPSGSDYGRGSVRRQGDFASRC